MNISMESNGDDLEINNRPQKTWKEALLLMSDLMQVQNSVKIIYVCRRKNLLSFFRKVGYVPNVICIRHVSMTELRFSQLLISIFFFPYRLFM